VQRAEPILLSVGGVSRTDLRAALQSHGVLLNAHAETLLDHEAFDLRDPVELTVVERGVGELCLGDGGTLQEVYAAAREQGLSLCPPDTGPHLRLAMRSQENAPETQRWDLSNDFRRFLGTRWYVNTTQDFLNNFVDPQPTTGYPMDGGRDRERTPLVLDRTF